MLNWLNQYSNVLMVILTAIYVIATIKLLRASKKQNKEAASMRESAVRIQTQNMSIHLFERRYEIYTIFKKNLLMSRGAFKALTLKDSSAIMYCCYFHNTEFDKLNILWDEAQTIEMSLEKRYDPALEKNYHAIRQKIFVEGINILRKETNEIKQIEFCFEGIEYNYIEDYLDALSSLIFEIGTSSDQTGKTVQSYFSKMCDHLTSIEDENIVEKLEEQMQISHLAL